MSNRRMLGMGLVTCALLGSVAVGTVLSGPKTWIVDDNGGPGVDFTDIAPAVAAADDGDLILVLAGSYSAFSVAKSLTIIGEGTVYVLGTVEIDPAPGVVSLASMVVASLDVKGCKQTVILDEVRANSPSAFTQYPLGSFIVNVDGCDDVRFVECDVGGGTEGDLDHALRVFDSRVELVSSTFGGYSGYDDDFSCFYVGSSAQGGGGGHGMVVLGTSRVHAAGSDFTGGDGGYAGSVWCSYAYAGDGGHAARVASTSELIAATGSFLAGDGGVAYAPNGYTELCGSGGNAIGGAGKVRYSGLILTAGLGSGSCPDGKQIASNKKTQVTPPDPRLERLSTPVSGFFGAPVTLRVHGEPGAFTRLFLGTEPLLVANPNIEVEALVKKRVTIDLGFMPGKGFVDYALPLGPDWPKSFYGGGRLILGQASCIYPGGELRRTNSLPLVLR